jgi:hypothetical protein
MKKIAAHLFLLIPFLASGQLFPKLNDFKGKIEKVVERQYGKEINATKRDSGLFHPGKFSGRKSIYLFDENSKLIRRTNTFMNEIIAEHSFGSQSTGSKRTERETIKRKDSDQAEYLEYENFMDATGKVQDVNFWVFDTKKNARVLLLIEKKAEYKNGQLVSFERYNIQENGDTASGETFHLSYDHSGQLTRIERKDIDVNIKTVLNYYYNKKGFVHRCSIDFLADLQEPGKTQFQDIYFKYDRHGNWTKKYWMDGRKKRIESKRAINYR